MTSSSDAATLNSFIMHTPRDVTSQRPFDRMNPRGGDTPATLALGMSLVSGWANVTLPSSAAARFRHLNQVDDRTSRRLHGCAVRVRRIRTEQFVSSRGHHSRAQNAQRSVRWQVTGRDAAILLVSGRILTGYEGRGHFVADGDLVSLDKASTALVATPPPTPAGPARAHHGFGGEMRRNSSKRLRTNVRCVGATVSASEGGAMATRTPSGCRAYIRLPSSCGPLAHALPRDAVCRRGTSPSPHGIGRPSVPACSRPPGR